MLRILDRGSFETGSSGDKSPDFAPSNVPAASAQQGKRAFAL